MFGVRVCENTPEGGHYTSTIEKPGDAHSQALQALLALDKSTETADLSYVTRKLVHLRASQINGCSVCIDMHAPELEKAGEKDERVFTVSAWRETPYFTDAERAALALTEAATRLADRPDPMPDAVWDRPPRTMTKRLLPPWSSRLP